MRNLTQSAYDRIKGQLSTDDADTWVRTRLRTQDAKDLLEAYEGAVRLLQDSMEDPNTREVYDFLYLKSGEPRVKLDEDEELSYSARGLLRPAESDDYEP